ncbi:MAG: peptide ABC transporter permease, partial [Stenotrophobium sp.]
MVRASATHPTAQLMERALSVKGRSLLGDARRRLFRNKAAVASMVLLALIALLAVFAPFMSPYA